MAILALDQGTTSSRAIVFDHGGQVLGMSQREFPQILPRPGEVEHDPEAIWSSQLAVAREALTAANVAPTAIRALGVTNQRETTVLWERDTGRPVAPAIVWQSRVSAELCRRHQTDGVEPFVRQRTGLVIDAYFSATKIQHLLDTTPGLRERAERGEILFGTVDSFLIWRLTGGRSHVTDVSNASRTLLFNLHTLDWDDELLRIFRVPRAMLPRVTASSGVIDTVAPELLGAPIPIAGVAGDQQAATFGQACFEPGMAKNTYGTGCFMLMNTGELPVESKNRLLTTVGWQMNGRTTYCLEGAVFVGGAVIQWLRDGLGVIRSSAESEALAATVSDTGGVYFVPAFVGLGAPHWDPWTRGAIFGLTRGTTAAHLTRAALESIAFQSADLVEAMQQDSGVSLGELRVDGGASRNDLLMQFQSDLLGRRVVRPTVSETTALGAAYLAGLAVGFWNDLDDVRRNWRLDRAFDPQMTDERRADVTGRWRNAVQAARSVPSNF